MNHRYSRWVLGLLLLSIPLLGAQESRSDTQKGKGYLGVQIQDVSRKVEKRFKVPSDEGAYVAEVVEDSPAEEAGLKEDDVVLTFDGKPVYDADDLTRFVQRTEPESKVQLTVWRDGAKKAITVTIGKRKERSFAFYSGAPGDDGSIFVWSGRASYGLQLNTLNEQLGSYFGVPDNKGVLVESVKKESAAAKAGFQAGDVITRVGKEKVTASADVVHELSDYEEGDKVDFEVYRKGSKTKLTLEVEKSDDGGLNYFFRDFGVDHAPRPRISVVPRPEMNLHIERFKDDVLRDTEKELRESLDNIREKEIRIRRVAPVLQSIRERITI